MSFSKTDLEKIKNKILISNEIEKKTKVCPVCETECAKDAKICPNELCNYEFP